VASTLNSGFLAEDRSLLGALLPSTLPALTGNSGEVKK
jgi:hypothetical protein